MATEVGIVPVGTVAKTLLELVSTIDTDDPFPLATTSRFPLGVMAIQSGEINPEIVPIWFPLESCTVTVPAFPLLTYTFPFGATPTAFGPDGVGKVLMTVFDAMSITETLVDPRLTTYACAPLGLIATWIGVVPTGMVATTELLAALITDTTFAPWHAT